MVNDQQVQFVILMSTLEEILKSVDVERLTEIQRQIKQGMPTKYEDMPYTIDQHPNDFLVMQKNVDFVEQVLVLAKLAHEIQELKRPAIAHKYLIHSKASQQ